MILTFSMSEYKINFEMYSNFVLSAKQRHVWSAITSVVFERCVSPSMLAVTQSYKQEKLHTKRQVIENKGSSCLSFYRQPLSANLLSDCIFNSEARLLHFFVRSIYSTDCISSEKRNRYICTVAINPIKASVCYTHV